jgi:RimJ/RimL family protein N-acetyltransferase
VTAAGIQLGDVHDDDLPVLFDWINDRELVLMSADFRPVSWEEHRAWFERLATDGSTHVFAIRESSTGLLLGSCQLLVQADDAGAAGSTAELRIRLGRADARGRGVGTAAVGSLVQHGFTQLGLSSIFLQVRADNPAAIRAYVKVGFVRDPDRDTVASFAGESVVMHYMRLESTDWSGQSSSAGKGEGPG